MDPTEGHQIEKGTNLTIPSPIIEDGSSGDFFGKDIGAMIVSEHSQNIDATVQRRVLRKIDFYSMPFMWIGYGFVYYDKACHGARAI